MRGRTRLVQQQLLAVVGRPIRLPHIEQPQGIASRIRIGHRLHPIPSLLFEHRADAPPVLELALRLRAALGVEQRASAVRRGRFGCHGGGWFVRESQVRAIGRSYSGSVRPMTAEERRQRTAFSESCLDPRHHRTPQRPHKHIEVGDTDEP
jgi:hypothetical protein